MSESTIINIDDHQHEEIIQAINNNNNPYSINLIHKLFFGLLLIEMIIFGFVQLLSIQPHSIKSVSSPTISERRSLTSSAIDNAVNQETNDDIPTLPYDQTLNAIIPFRKNIAQSVKDSKNKDALYTAAEVGKVAGKTALAYGVGGMTTAAITAGVHGGIVAGLTTAVGAGGAAVAGFIPGAVIGGVSALGGAGYWAYHRGEVVKVRTVTQFIEDNELITKSCLLHKFPPAFKFEDGDQPSNTTRCIPNQDKIGGKGVFMTWDWAKTCCVNGPDTDESHRYDPGWSARYWCKCTKYPEGCQYCDEQGVKNATKWDALTY